MGRRMRNNNIYFIAFFSGFLSLGLEILWMRLISFAGMSVPQAFSYTLAMFLFGIACGAQIGRLLCRGKLNIRRHFIGWIFILSAIIDIFLLYIVYKFINYSMIVMGVCVFVSATFRGIIFPLVHHIGTEEKKTGTQISNVYFSNVLGSVLAPLIIGYLALDYLNTQQVYLIICIISFLISIFCFERILINILIFSGSLVLFPLLLIPEKIYFELSKNSYKLGLYPSKIIENKYGFIQVYDDGDERVVLGANVYDGKFNTNIFNDTNGIDRAYLLTTMQPEAKKALVIGLSTGSWVKVLSMMPNLEEITVLEINPGYKDLISSEPLVADILKDKRIKFIFEDGRSWLKKNKENKYDIILMNTTWHWRAYVSNLLSIEFLKILDTSLNNDGVLYYNSTQSMNAYSTAKQVYPYVYKYKYFILASRNKKEVNVADVANKLCKLKDRVTNKPTFKDYKECYFAATKIMEDELVSYENIEFKEDQKNYEIITDNNMITEYKFGKGISLIGN